MMDNLERARDRALLEKFACSDGHKTLQLDVQTLLWRAD